MWIKWNTPCLARKSDEHTLNCDKLYSLFFNAFTLTGQGELWSYLWVNHCDCYQNIQSRLIFIYETQYHCSISGMRLVTSAFCLASEPVTSRFTGSRNIFPDTFTKVTFRQPGSAFGTNCFGTRAGERRHECDLSSWLNLWVGTPPLAW